jgi:hypothetical protein
LQFCVLLSISLCSDLKDIIAEDQEQKRATCESIKSNRPESFRSLGKTSSRASTKLQRNKKAKGMMGKKSRGKHM